MCDIRGICRCNDIYIPYIHIRDKIGLNFVKKIDKMRNTRRTHTLIWTDDIRDK